MKAVERATRVGSHTYVGLEILDEEQRGQPRIGSELADGVVELVVGRRSDAMIVFDIDHGSKDTEKDRQILNRQSAIPRSNAI